MNENIKKLREQLKEICEKTNTSFSGMDYLVKYYIKDLHWSEEKAIEYAISLFHNGTIREIKLFNSNGEELWGIASLKA